MSNKTKKSSGAVAQAKAEVEQPVEKQYFALTLEQANTLHSFFLDKVITREGLPFVNMLANLPTISFTESPKNVEETPKTVPDVVQ